MTTSSSTPIGAEWTLIYDAATSGPFTGVVASLHQDQIALRVAASLPSASDPGFPINSWVYLALSEKISDKLYAKAADGNSAVVMDQRIGMSLLPPWMVTAGNEVARRLKVDSGSAGFYDSREMRYFREFNIPAGFSWWTKIVVSGAGIILENQVVTLGAGDMRFRAWRDLTIDATFVAPGTPADAHTNDAALCSGLFKQNGLPASPAYTNVTLVTQSGAEVSVSGGTCSESRRINTAGATAQQLSVGFTTNDERGIAPATYHLEFQALGNSPAIGTYDLKYQEELS